MFSTVIISYLFNIDTIKNNLISFTHKNYSGKICNQKEIENLVSSYIKIFYSPFIEVSNNGFNIKYFPFICIQTKTNNYYIITSRNKDYFLLNGDIVKESNNYSVREKEGIVKNIKQEEIIYEKPGLLWGNYKYKKYKLTIEIKLKENINTIKFVTNQRLKMTKEKVKIVPNHYSYVGTKYDKANWL